MRSIWKGALGFGLVNIPVQMYSATEESTIPFVSLDKNNHARIRYKKVNEATGKEVPFRDIVKGYEIGGTMVLVDEEDIKKASPEKFDQLSIVQFVNEDEIDARYYEKPYYLQPALCALAGCIKKRKESRSGTTCVPSKRMDLSCQTARQSSGHAPPSFPRGNKRSLRTQYSRGQSKRHGNENGFSAHQPIDPAV